MTEDLRLHESSSGASLNRSYFRPRFEDSDLEGAWMVERLGTFRRVNRRALWVLLGACLVFVAVDLVTVKTEVEVFLTRLAIVAFVWLLLFAVMKVRSIQLGDALILVASIAGLAVVWFQIFMKLPIDLVRDYWLVTVALFVMQAFVLVEMMLLARLGVSLMVLLFSLSAPMALGLGSEETVVAMIHVVLIALVGWVAAWQVEIARRLAFVRRLETEEERSRTVDLLRNILPIPIADRLLKEPGMIAERHASVTVLFADIVGFTPWASSCEADEVVGVLDEIFSEFDALCDKHGVEKIKTIGDAYMAAAGVPTNVTGGARSVVSLALDMMLAVGKMRLQGGASLQLRIGVHEGPVVAGVIGRRKFIYDLWGDTVNTAARMESHGVPGRVQVTEQVASQLDESFLVEPRGVIEVKGKGPMTAFLVGPEPTSM
jgi:class 3 adenylate cyclase